MLPRHQSINFLAGILTVIQLVSVWDAPLEPISEKSFYYILGGIKFNKSVSGLNLMKK